MTANQTATAAPDNNPLRARVITAATWSVAAYGIGFATRLGGNLILTRLLSPHDFGLMALLGVVVAGLYLLSDFGITPCVIRSERGDDPRFLDTAWTITLLRGLGLFLVSCAVAYPASLFYDEPRLAYMLPVLTSGSLLLASFRSTKVITAERHLDAKRVNLLELITQLSSLVVMVGWAWIAPSVWALVIGAIASSAIQVALSFVMFPGKGNRFAWDKTALEELARFGRWVMLSTALAFFATQTDRAVLGKLVSLSTLGVIGLGLQLADLPKQLVTRLGGQVLLPTISKLSHLPRAELRELIMRQRRRFLPWAAIAFAAGCALSDVAVDIMYDERYAAAGWVASTMLISAWIALLSLSVDSALIAFGKPKVVAAANFGVALMNFVAIPLGYVSFGVVGAVIALAARQTCYYIVISFGLNREQLGCGRQDAALTLLFVVSLAAAISLRMVLGFGHPFELAFSG